MTAWICRADTWLGAPAPAERLGALRVVTSLFATGYLAVSLPAFLALADEPASRFEPVGVLAWLGSPLPAVLWIGLVVASLGLGATSAAGAWFRLSGPGFAALLLVVMTYRSSWGQLLWFEALVVLHVVIIGLAPSADAVSVDARRAGSSARDGGAYGFPIRLAALVTVTTYVLAGIAKLRIGGSGWLDGETLRNHIAYSAARLEVLGGTPSPVARPFMEHEALLAPMAVASVAVELAAPIALLGGRIRSAWVAAAWTMHAAIAALMFVVFPYPLALVAFAPFYRLERLRLRRWRRNRR
jgi:hypothetical protein